MAISHEIYFCTINFLHLFKLDVNIQSSIINNMLKYAKYEPKQYLTLKGVRVSFFA